MREKSIGDDIWGKGETKFFYQLTPSRILQAVEVLGYSCTGRCLTLNSMENRVYEVEVYPDTNQERENTCLIIKFYRPGRWSQEQIKEELQFLHQLAQEEIPVIAPLKINGESLFYLEEEKLWYALFPKKGGRAPQEMNREQWEILGRQIGRVHIVGKKEKAKHRLTLNPQNFTLKNLEYLIDSQSLPLYLESEYKNLVQAVYNKSQALFKGIELQRIHGDCHWGNIIIRDGEGLFFIDFDDMLIGPCVQDLWLLGAMGDKRDFEVFLAAYESMTYFNPKELKLIEALRAFRYIHFSAWIARRWEDPAFKNGFSHYGDDQYWVGQINDLKDQLEKIE